MVTFTTPSGVNIDTGASNTGATVVPPTNGVNTGGSSGASGSTGSTDTSSFISQLQQKLLGQSDIISSENTNLENKINTAIKGIQTGQDASAQAITSQYDQNIQQARDTGQSKLTSALELQRGFASNVAGLKQLATDTDKQVQSLEQQKQQLILTGQANAASQISNLQIQAIQFQQQAQQQVFSNLLGMGNFAQQQQQAETQASQFKATQDFASQQAISTVALKYGLTVGANDTLSSITTKAMPFASQEEKLQLQQIQSQIALNNAQRQKALSDAASGGPVDAAQIAALAQASLTNPAVLGLIKDPNVAAQVINKASDIQYNGYVSSATDLQSQGLNKSAAIREVNGDATLSPADKAAALKAVDQVFGTTTTVKNTTPGVKFSAPGTAEGFVNAKPLPPATPEAKKALDDILKKSSLGAFR